jgi:hypothetical protein
VNVVWALANLVAGYFLFRAGKVCGADLMGPAVFFAGFAIISILSSFGFAKKHTS